jgi:uncharacterized protein YegJ (DUF2314 family)
LGAPGASRTSFLRDQVEHIWLFQVRYDGEVFHAIVGSKPAKVKNVALKQEVKVRPSEITDWILDEDGEVSGGYTIRLMRCRMSDEDQKKFDEQSGFKFD